jgi:hypothetical protein
VTDCHTDPLPRQKLSYAISRVALRGKRHDSRQSTGRIQQPLHEVDVGESRAIFGVRADITDILVQKGSLDVNAPYHFRN